MQTRCTSTLPSGRVAGIQLGPSTSAISTSADSAKIKYAMSGFFSRSDCPMLENAASASISKMMFAVLWYCQVRGAIKSRRGNSVAGAGSAASVSSAGSGAWRWCCRAVCCPPSARRCEGEVPADAVAPRCARAKARLQLATSCCAARHGARTLGCWAAAAAELELKTQEPGCPLWGESVGT